MWQAMTLNSAETQQCVRNIISFVQLYAYPPTHIQQTLQTRQVDRHMTRPPIREADENYEAHLFQRSVFHVPNISDS